METKRDRLSGSVSNPGYRSDLDLARGKSLGFGFWTVDRTAWEAE